MDGALNAQKIRDGRGDYNTTDDVICYRLTRLPFGLTCRLFLLSMSLRGLATMNKGSFPTAATLADSCTFMGDFATCANDSKGAIAM